MFDRCHFSAELSDNSAVRFVVSGQELRNDDSTLRMYRVTDGTVIHCLITRHMAHAERLPASRQQYQMGVLIFPIFGIMLFLLWYIRFAYRQYFNGASTFSLVAISFIYMVAFFASIRGGEINHQHGD